MAPKHATGSGYVFAEKAGAVFSNMDYLPAYPGECAGFRYWILVSVSAKTSDFPGPIWVNIDGNRMMDEMNYTNAEIQNTWATAPDNIVFIVFNEAIKEANDPIFTVSSQEDEGWERFEEEIEKGEVVFKADTIE